MGFVLCFNPRVSQMLANRVDSGLLLFFFVFVFVLQILRFYRSVGLGFVYFIIISCVLSANRVDLGFFVSLIFQFYSPPLPLERHNPRRYVRSPGEPMDPGDPGRG